MKPGKLYVIASPIGNLGDISQRAADAINDADFIAAEDTRVTGVLLSRLGIRKPMVSYHKFNETTRAPELAARIMGSRAASPQNCALITDAGSPGVSDPGQTLVAQAAQQGIEIIPIPGPSAVTAALSISGFNGTTYGFYGFPPKGKKAKEALISMLNDSHGIIILFESPNRITETVVLLQELQSTASLVLCNDLTKLYERIYRGTPEQVLEQLNANPNAHKGEYTLVIQKTPKPTEPDTSPSLSIEAKLTDICVKNAVSLKEAVTLLYNAEKTRLSKKDIYAASLNIKKLFVN